MDEFTGYRPTGFFSGILMARSKLKLSEEELSIILKHEGLMLQSAIVIQQRLKSINPQHRTAKVVGDILYWDHCIAALKWSMQIAKQRKVRRSADGEEVPENGEGSV